MTSHFTKRKYRFYVLLLLFGCSTGEFCEGNFHDPSLALLHAQRTDCDGKCRLCNGQLILLHNFICHKQIFVSNIEILLKHLSSWIAWLVKERKVHYIWYLLRSFNDRASPKRTIEEWMITHFSISGFQVVQTQKAKRFGVKPTKKQFQKCSSIAISRGLCIYSPVSSNSGKCYTLFPFQHSFDGLTTWKYLFS